MRRVFITVLSLMIVVLLATPAQAQGSQQSSARDDEKEQVTNIPLAKALAIVGACLGAGLCAAGAGYSIARVGSSCIESIARQPEAGGAMFAPMVVTAAMIEGGMLLAIVVCILGVLFI